MSEPGKRYQEALNKGNSSAWDQDWERATAYYRQALGEKPRDPKALTSLALALLKTQSYKESLNYYLQANKVTPQDPVPLEKAATIYEILGKQDIGADVAVRAAELYLKISDIDKAIENWTRALGMNSEHLVAHSRLAVVYERMQRIPQAVREYIHIASLMQFQGEREKAIQSVNRALKLNPNHEEAQQALAMLRNNIQIPKPARPQGGTGPIHLSQSSPHTPLLDEAKEDQYDHTTPVEETRQKALETLATLFFEQSSEETTEKSAKEGGFKAILDGTGSLFAKNVDKNQMMLHLGQAVEYLTLKDFEHASTELKRVTDLGLNHPAAFFLLGLIHLEGNRLESAERALKRAVGHSDYILSTRILLGKTYQKKGNFRQASISYLEALCQADSFCVESKHADDLRQLYEPIIETHSQTAGDHHIKQLIKTISEMLERPGWRSHIKGTRLELVPDEGGPPTPLAEVLTEASSSEVVVAISRIKQLVREGHHQAAFEESLFAIQIAPTYLPLHVTIGELLLSANQIQSAIQKFNVISRAYNVRGDKSRSIEMLQQVVEMSPMDMDNRKILIDLFITSGRSTDAVEEIIRMAEIQYSLAELAEARKTYTQALQYIQKSGLDNQWRVRLLHRVADIDIQRLNWRQALEIYQQICKIHPDDLEANRRVIDLNFRLGERNLAESQMSNYVQTLVAEGRNKDVITFLEKLEADWPKHASLKQLLADLYQKEGRAQDALQYLEDAIEILLDSGDRSGAAEAIQRVIIINPKDADRYRHLLGNLK